MRQRHVVRRTGVTTFVLGVTLAVGLAAGCGTIAAQTAPSDEGGEDAPEITNYNVSADGGEITVSFDSDENLIKVTVEITGTETATLDREDFDGARISGFTATYNANSSGSYTVELTEARDSSNNDGTVGESFSQSVTVDSEDDDANETATPTATATATPTPTPTSAPTPTPTATPTPTPTPTPTDEPSGATASPTGQDQSGFDAVVALVALAATLMIARRRSGGE